MPEFLSTDDADFERRFAALLGQKREEAEDVDQAVAVIIADVRARGDAAVLELTARFERLELAHDHGADGSRGCDVAQQRRNRSASRFGRGLPTSQSGEAQRSGGA